MTDAQKTILDLNAMMDSTLDSVPEAPDFLNPPAGEYQLSIRGCKAEDYKQKDQTDASRIRLSYAVESTLSSEEPPVPDGSLFSETFQGTEQGLGYFKKQAKKILNVESLDGAKLGEIFTTLIGTSFRCRIAIRKTVATDGSGRVFENLTITPIHPAAGG